MLGLTIGVILGGVAGLFAGMYVALENMTRSAKGCRACGRRWIQPHGQRPRTVRVIEPDDGQPDAPSTN